MMATRKVGFFLSLGTIILLSEVDCTLPAEFWNIFAPPTTTQPSTPSTTKEPQLDDYTGLAFQGIKFHPTESYPYPPTTPAVDHGFEKWEQEQEKKYAQDILAQLSSPNDTELQIVAKSLIANFLVNAAMDDSTAALNSSTTEDYYPDYVDQPTAFPTKSPSGNYDIPTREPIFEPDQVISEQPFPIASQTPMTFNPVQSILNVLSQNQSGEGGSSSPLGSILNMFAPKPSQPRTTPDPDVSTEYYIVPVNPITEANAISKQAANLGKQVERLVQNVNNRNISGVVDETLKIASLETIGVFITGFLNALLCNPIDRWNGRCDE